MYRQNERIYEYLSRISGHYGYRLIALEMNRSGRAINRKAVLKLKNACGIRCQVRRYW